MNIQEIKNCKIEIEPLKLNIDKPLTKREIAPLPNTNHVMLISGSMGSGKSTFAYSLICGKGKSQVYRKVYDSIFFVIPCSSYNSLDKRHPLRKHDKVFHQLDHGLISRVKEAAEKNKEDDRNTLLILDDVGHALKDNSLLVDLQELVFRHRHLNLSIWFIVQTLKSVPLQLRKVFTNYILFKPKNGRELDDVLVEVMTMNKDEINQLFRYVYKNKHDLMFVDIANSKIHRNFNELFISRNDIDETSIEKGDS